MRKELCELTKNSLFLNKQIASTIDENSQRVTRQTLLRNVGLHSVRDFEDRMGFSAHPAHGTTMAGDPTVSYYKRSFERNLIYMIGFCGFFTYFGDLDEGILS